MEVLIALVIGIPAMMLLLAMTSAVRAVTLSILWKWFIVPTFGLAPLEPLHAFGLSLFLGYLMPNHSQSKKDKGWEEVLSDIVGNALVVPVVVLAIGYVVKSFM